jgi:hypothetical protein
MRLKLDLHPIFNDAQRIEAALNGIIDEAVAKRVDEVEIIPGKGSGALKKSVLRFLDRPEVKARYHRFEKDGDNWGRLFVYFRHERGQGTGRAAPETPRMMASYACFCCGADARVEVDLEDLRDSGPATRTEECPSCASPNRLTIRADRKGNVRIDAEPGYE